MPGDTNSAWQRLTPSYQNGTAEGRDYYNSFWGQMRSVTVSGASATGPSSVQATITYDYWSGRRAVELTAYEFVNDNGTLKINSSQVLSDRSG